MPLGLRRGGVIQQGSPVVCQVGLTVETTREAERCSLRSLRHTDKGRHLSSAASRCDYLRAIKGPTSRAMGVPAQQGDDLCWLLVFGEHQSSVRSLRRLGSEIQTSVVKADLRPRLKGGSRSSTQCWDESTSL